MLTIDELLNLNEDELKSYHSTLRNNYYNNKNNQSLDSLIDPITLKPKRDIDSDYIKKVSSSIIKKEENPIYLDYHSTGKNPFINKKIKLTDVLTMIQSGNNNIPLIEKARSFGKESSEYVKIKMEQLPSVNFNFNFKIKTLKTNIIASTGLIYIDVDDVDSLDTSNNLIYAAWKSLSNTGFGILVKVSGLTPNNFSTNYLELSNILNIKSDIGAYKATQQNIISYDPSIYINNNSDTFLAINEKVSSSIIKNDINNNDSAPQGLEKKREKTITLEDTFLKDYTGKTRYDNISDFFDSNDDNGFILFDDKIKIIQAYITKTTIGNRSNNLFAFLARIAALNPETNFVLLKIEANRFNTYCTPPLPEEKINAIINNVIKRKNNNDLNTIPTKERKILLKPSNNLTKKEKQKLIGEQLGKVKTDKTQKEIYTIIENWDFVTNGQLTQINIAQQLGKSTITIKRHWHIVKELVKTMKQNFKNGIKYDALENEIIKEDTLSVQPEIVQPEPTVEVENPKKTAMKNRFDRVFKYQPNPNRTMTPGEFQSLTFYSFYHFPFKIIFNSCENIKKNDFEIFWATIQNLKSLLPKYADRKKPN